MQKNKTKQNEIFFPEDWKKIAFDSYHNILEICPDILWLCFISLVFQIILPKNL